MSKKKYSSPNFEKKKKQNIIRKVILRIFALAILIYGIFFWMNHKSMAVTDIQISGAVLSDEEKIRTVVEEIISKKTLGIISNRNFIFLPSLKIEEKLEKENLTIDEVIVDVVGLHTVKIEVTEYTTVAKWCGQNVAHRLKDCYLINNEGTFFTQEFAMNSKEVPILYGPISDDFILGKKYLEQDQFENLLFFVANLGSLDMVIKSVETEDFETFAVKISAGPYIFISIKNSGEKTLNNLKTIIDAEEINKAQLSNLEYIDLKFNNKAYYKIK